METSVVVDKMPVTTKKDRGLISVYLWTLSYLMPYKGMFMLLLLFLAIISGAELVIPKFFQYFIDVILPNGDKRAMLWMVAAIPVLCFVIIGGRAIQLLLQRQIQEKASRDLQFSIFQHLRILGFSYYEKHPVGETLSFLNTEVSALQRLYRGILPWFLNAIIFSVISLTLMITTNALLSLILIPSFLLYYIFGPAIDRKTAIYYKQVADRRVEENQKVYESISALTELRAYGVESWDIKRYVKKVAARNESEVNTVFFNYLRGSNRQMSYNIGALCIFGLGFILITDEKLSVGNYVAFTLYYLAAMQSMTNVVSAVTHQRMLMHQARKLYDFMQLEPDVTEPVNPVELGKVEGQMEFRNVHYSYHLGMPVVQGFDLTVQKGTRVAIVGTSGSGKSTVLKLAGRFYDPQQGEIMLDGVPLRELSFDTVRNSFGFVFQETYLFGSSVKDNIRFGDPDASDKEVIEAAKAANAHDFIMELPDGYDTLVGERGTKLSGGQRQRVGIARMFIRQPSVILLDEATSALDNTSESVVQEALGRLLKGRTTIAVAHRISTIQDYDKIVVMEQGKAVESGTYDELLSRKGAFYQLIEGLKVEEENDV